LPRAFPSIPLVGPLVKRNFSITSRIRRLLFIRPLIPEMEPRVRSKKDTTVASNWKTRV